MTLDRQLSICRVGQNEGCSMNPNMLDIELLDVLIYIKKGPCVIDRTETDWGKAFLIDRHYLETRFVYSKNETKDCLGSKFATWWNNRERWIKPTLEEAMRFADDIANGRSEKAAKRQEDALLARRIEDVEQKCRTLNARFVNEVDGRSGPGGRLFVENPLHVMPVQFLSLQEQYQQAVERLARLSKKAAEAPEWKEAGQQLVLPVNGSLDAKVPPWKQPTS